MSKDEGIREEKLIRRQEQAQQGKGLSNAPLGVSGRIETSQCIGYSGEYFKWTRTVQLWQKETGIPQRFIKGNRSRCWRF